MGVPRGIAIVLLAAGCPAWAAVAGTAAPDPGSPDTWAQHHRWTRKFEPLSDPEVTGSLSRPASSDTQASRKQCVPGGLGFSNPPLSAWRIDDC